MRLFLFIFGLASLSFGLTVVFNIKFLNFMRKTLWKETWLDKKWFPGKSGYIYDRYITGVSSIIMGLGFLLFAIFAF